jgi:8-oxo-dGTP pyrophosphatase MutT (NUDIX family)
MSKKCDNTSVGIIIRHEGKILMIERKQYNFGFALPAGHQDGDEPIACAKKETGEEVGLIVEEAKVILRNTLLNPCNREGGTYHDWVLVEAVKWHGNVDINQPDDEAKSYFWADKEKITLIAERLEKFVDSLGMELLPQNLPEVVRATNQKESWRKNPGLEPPIYFLFKELKLI